MFTILEKHIIKELGLTVFDLHWEPAFRTVLFMMILYMGTSHLFLMTSSVVMLKNLNIECKSFTISYLHSSFILRYIDFL